MMLWWSKRERDLESKLDRALNTVAELKDAEYVANQLAKELGLYNNYRTYGAYAVISAPRLNVKLLAKDLRADTETTERSSRLAPLKKKENKDG